MSRVSSRGEATRDAILMTALRLFAEKGFEATTMRSIASEAGVSLGNAYYYFSSKDDLAAAFYVTLSDEHIASVRDRLTDSQDLTERIRVALGGHLEVLDGHRNQSGLLLRLVSTPSGALSPFSPQEGVGPRAATTRLFADVVDGRGVRPPEPLRSQLPRLLWLVHVAVVLFWAHDRSPDSRHTRELVDRVALLVGTLAAVSRLPVLRRFTGELVDLVNVMAGWSEAGRPGNAPSD
jgi:AcrR family transcriptional regulator